MASPYLSQITMFGGNFAPKNYALCNGQLLSIQQNQALFALLGTTYGGNGTQNFALPNLQSALPMSFGQGAGLSNYCLLYTSVKDARKFMSAARAAARAKPVLVIKSGRHAQGAKAAMTHTGALAGSDAVYDAAFHRACLLYTSSPSRTRPRVFADGRET